MRPMIPILAAFSSALAVFSAVPALAQTPTLLIDGQPALFDVPPIVADGHVLVPLRGVFEKLGADVAYDAETQVVTARLGYRIVRLTLGSRHASVNGSPVMLEVPARDFAGRVEVPLRFVAEALGVNVDYDAADNTIAVVSGKPFHPGGFVAAISGPSERYAAAYGPSGPTAPRIEDMRPDPDSLIGSPYPQIYARFAGGSSPVNPNSVRVTFDGDDVTDRATISSAYVSFTPSQALETGSHDVQVSGQADDGTPFSGSWSFRVDAGNVRTDFTAVSAGGFGGLPFSGSPFCCANFGFFPPGFSVFTPGTIEFFAGNVIEIIFFNRFFPFGSGFFTNDGFPGIFNLVPWTGFPGFFWGTATVPFGVHVSNAIVSAHFKSSSGQTFIVHSTAPLTIDGTRTKAPSTLRYAVMPVLVNHPISPRRLVIFKHFEHPTTMQHQLIREGGAISTLHAGMSSGTALRGRAPATIGVERMPIFRQPAYRQPASSTSRTSVIHAPSIERPAGPSGTSTYHSTTTRRSAPSGVKPLTGINHQ